MNLLDFVKTQAEKLATVPNAAEFVQKLAEAAKAAGFDLLANNVAEQTYVSKHRLDEAVAAKNTYKADIEARDKQLADLAKQIKDNEPLLTQVKDFQTTNEQLKGQLKDQSLNFAIQRSLTGANAKYPDLLIGKVDRTKLQLSEDGQTVTGLDEQVKSLQENFKDLFAPAVPPATGGGGTNPPATPPGPKSLADALAAKYGG